MLHLLQEGHLQSSKMTKGKEAYFLDEKLPYV